MRHSGEGRAGCRRAPALVALLGLLMLPVEYRAGAETAHVHAAVQLWYEAARRIVDHHVDYHDDDHGLPPDVRSPRGATGGTNTSEPRGIAAAGRGPDVPRLTEAFLVADGVALIAPVAVFSWALALRCPLPGREAVRVVRGRSCSPPTPPPRAASVLG